MTRFDLHKPFYVASYYMQQADSLFGFRAGFYDNGIQYATYQEAVAFLDRLRNHTDTRVKVLKFHYERDANKPNEWTSVKEWEYEL